MAGAALRLAREARRLRADPRLQGSARVMVLPGFGTTDVWTLPLRRVLASLGHEVRGWGLGRNTGELKEILPPLRERVARWTEEAGEPVALVGWSLGGVLAREVARHDPASVARVVTLGSPVQGGPKYTFVARHQRRQGRDLDRLEHQVAELNRTRIGVPLASIYTRADSVVHWEASLDPWHDHAEHIEVSTTHGGLVLCPRVIREIARLLAEPQP